MKKVRNEEINEMTKLRNVENNNKNEIVYKQYQDENVENSIKR